MVGYMEGPSLFCFFKQKTKAESVTLTHRREEKRREEKRRDGI
jgi:hypothetical protein